MAGTIGLKSCSAAAIRRLIVAAPPLTRLLHLVNTQPYATSAFATAQPQLDNDYYYHHRYNDNENQQKESEAVPMVDAEGFVPTKAVQWVFIGNPGAKKHVYAEKISKLLEVPHISIGSLVRQDLSPSSSLYKQIANAVNQGKLVPEDIMFGLLSKRLEDGLLKCTVGKAVCQQGRKSQNKCDLKRDFMVDDLEHAVMDLLSFRLLDVLQEILDKLLDIELVVNFKCAEDYLLEHHGDNVFSHSHQSDRFSGSGCGSLNVDSPRTQTKYSFCNGKAHIHHKQMKPVEDYYKKQNKLINFQVGSAPGETWRGLLAALHLQHINAALCRLTSGSTGV
ncbi:hypothetical protein RHMOL_Rhmol12G0205700 [Rhododendron molle]|uniref:Uncharacterized protein n=1 Tax=Rhododendron molle TaxID=49168 RepID=A0ACC0LKG0_RHOML|nr:hypothetical protein RHMOL_Rhmol12G0205700 [Rhododendron molle]